MTKLKDEIYNCLNKLKLEDFDEMKLYFYINVLYNQIESNVGHFERNNEEDDYGSGYSHCAEELLALKAE